MTSRLGTKNPKLGPRTHAGLTPIEAGAVIDRKVPIRRSDFRVIGYIATRVQGLANANEIYMSREVMDTPGVSDILKVHSVVSDHVRVTGVGEKLEVSL